MEIGHDDILKRRMWAADWDDVSIFTQKKKIDQTMVVIDEKLFVRAYSLSHRGMWEFEYREQRYFARL